MHIRQFSLWFSMFHACFVVLIVPLAILQHLLPLFSLVQGNNNNDATTTPLSWSETAWPLRLKLEQDIPTQLEMIVAIVAGTYYFTDFVLMWLNVHPLTINVKIWFTLHHIFCFIGLIMPTIVYLSALDTVLAFGGYWLGEISNPPRCIVDLIQVEIDLEKAQWVKRRKKVDSDENNGAHGDHGGASTKGNGNGSNGGSSKSPMTHATFFGHSWPLTTLEKTMSSLLTFHLIMFIALRFLGTHYMYEFVWKQAELNVTLVGGGITTILSWMAVVAMLQGARAGNSPQEHHEEQHQDGQTNGTTTKKQK